jgi:hypothetical protein
MPQGANTTPQQLSAPPFPNSVPPPIVFQNKCSKIGAQTISELFREWLISPRSQKIGW